MTLMPGVNQHTFTWLYIISTYAEYAAMVLGLSLYKVILNNCIYLMVMVYSTFFPSPDALSPCIAAAFVAAKFLSLEGRRTKWWKLG